MPRGFRDRVATHGSRMSFEVQYPRDWGRVGSWFRGAQKCGNLGEATRHGRLLLVSHQIKVPICADSLARHLSMTASEVKEM